MRDQAQEMGVRRDLNPFVRFLKMIEVNDKIDIIRMIEITYKWIIGRNIDNYGYSIMSYYKLLKWKLEKLERNKKMLENWKKL